MNNIKSFVIANKALDPVGNMARQIQGIIATFEDTNSQTMIST